MSIFYLIFNLSNLSYLIPHPRTPSVSSFMMLNYEFLCLRLFGAAFQNFKSTESPETLDFLWYDEPI